MTFFEKEKAQFNMEATQAIFDQVSEETRTEILIKLLNNDVYVLFVRVLLTWISSSYFFFILAAASYVLREAIKEGKQDSVHIVLACLAVCGVRIFS